MRCETLPAILFIFSTLQKNTEKNKKKVQKIEQRITIMRTFANVR